MSRAEHSFRGRLYQVGQLRCVDVPARVAAALGGGGRIPVHAEVAGVEKRTTLMPAGEGALRLFVDGKQRRAAGADSGDEVEVHLRCDSSAGDADAPPALAAELRRAPRLQAAFDSLTPRQRREFAGYISASKTTETRERRVAKALAALEDRAAGRPLRKERD